MLIASEINKKWEEQKKEKKQSQVTEIKETIKDLKGWMVDFLFCFVEPIAWQGSLRNSTESGNNFAIFLKSYGKRNAAYTKPLLILTIST